MSDESRTRFSLDDLREGFLVDYGMRTWEVTNHAEIPYEGWPAASWELESGPDELVLEYEPEDGRTFRLSRRIDVDDVLLDGRSFRQVMRMQEREDNEPGSVCYEGREYTLAEKDARVHEEARVREENNGRINFLSRSRADQVLLGICGGLANYWGVSLPSFVSAPSRDSLPLFFWAHSSGSVNFYASLFCSSMRDSPSLCSRGRPRPSCSITTGYMRRAIDS